MAWGLRSVGVLGRDGWSGAELVPLFARATERMRIRRFAPEEIQPFQRAFLESTVARGVPQTDDLDDLDGGMGCAS
jgi:choline dehydrogenase